MGTGREQGQATGSGLSNKSTVIAPGWLRLLLDCMQSGQRDACFTRGLSLAVETVVQPAGEISSRKLLLEEARRRRVISDQVAVPQARLLPVVTGKLSLDSQQHTGAGRFSLAAGPPVLPVYP